MREILLHLLDGNVFHVTNRKGYAGIKKQGKIRHNGDGEFSYAFAPSPNSYGNWKGWVCLFDFRNFPGWDWGGATPELLLNPNYNNNPIFLMLSEEIYPELKLQSQEKKNIPLDKLYVPKVECWFPGDIDINKFQITTVYCVNIIQNPENDLGRRLEAAHKKVLNNRSKD